MRCVYCSVTEYLESPKAEQCYCSCSDLRKARAKGVKEALERIRGTTMCQQATVDAIETELLATQEVDNEDG